MEVLGFRQGMSLSDLIFNHEFHEFIEFANIF
jgi:hypothetical protein